MNAYHIENGHYGRVDTSPFIDKLSEENYFIFEWLKSIAFYDGIAVIQKLNKPREESYDATLSGNNCPIICLSK